ncbi:MAG TPA: S26 family signal peptidase [Desulfitobacterium dehalogenans]|uniref:S26 family signal peptidase n=1 Tax=Desulfitobacterium dehalogenans TaxID=36854 RepID=A0A7C6Z509_9FIRM|nr:S26 family signal peptidase [Desulfitobacterium dehalogenans]
MIYRNSFFKKELRQAYTENKISTNRKISFALFLGLISFALYFVFQTLQESVLSDAVPEIMQPSYFSTIYIYIHLAYFLSAGYYIIYYDTLFFSEIRKNSWYLMIHMGYTPAGMFFSKLLALGYTSLFVYTLGFVAILLFTSLLKFPLIIAYLPSLFLVGLIDLVLLTILSMVFSLYVRTIINARYGIGVSAFLILLLKIVLGHYDVISNRVAMQNIFNLFDMSLSRYLPFWVIVVIICGLVCLFRADSLARYYNLSEDLSLLPPDASMILMDSKTGKKELIAVGGKQVMERKLIHKVVTVLVTAFIGVALAINVFIILINASTTGQEVSIRGVIPFIFQSNTMEPEIMVNDLTYFQKLDPRYPLKIGQIILFKENNVFYIERVVAIHGDNLVVDIDNYPPMSQIGAMKKTVPRENIHGVYSGGNRWLGALILFANTIMGRILFLLIPAILLFYHEQIVKLLKG